MMIKIKCPCETDARACCACVSMHCDECHNHSKFEQGRFCSNCGRPLKAELKRNYVPREEVDKLDYTLLGVMHSVDKWLDGDELEQDEVNRAITMREKALRIIETIKADTAKAIFEEIDEGFDKIAIVATNDPEKHKNASRNRKR